MDEWWGAGQDGWDTGRRGCSLSSDGSWHWIKRHLDGDIGYQEIRTNPNPLTEMCSEYLRHSTRVTEDGVDREWEEDPASRGHRRFQDVPKVGEVGKTQRKGLSLT